MNVPQAAERLEKKINAIIAEHPGDQETVDAKVNLALDLDEILTLGLMPINGKLRTYVVGCLLRDTKRKKDVDKLKEQVKQDELVPVEVHGGGKCKITIFMTREARDRERSR